MTHESNSEVVASVHAHIVNQLGPIDPGDRSPIRRAVEHQLPLSSAAQVESITELVAQRLFGLGPLESLLADPTVSEIMINGPGPAWVERDGQLVPTTVVVDHDTLRVLIERIIAPLGLRADRTAPFVDARLPDGSRVHVAVPPLALDGPYLTIRRFRSRPFRLDDFAGAGVVRLLELAVADGLSVLVSGGTGSGKTSLLNALAACIAPNERVVTLEDAAELRLPGEHVVRLETRRPNAEGVGGVDMRTLVRNALRMRPDRIVVGEVRGAEALDMVQAMNTGHDGSMTTCHANSPTDALRRVEAMALMSDVDLPLALVSEQLRRAVSLVIQVERGCGGNRVIRSVLQCGDQPRDLVQAGDLTEAGQAFVSSSERVLVGVS